MIIVIIPFMYLALLRILLKARANTSKMHPSWFYLSLSLVGSAITLLSRTDLVAKFLMLLNLQKLKYFLMHSSTGFWLVSPISFVIFCTYLVTPRPKLSLFQALYITFTLIITVMIFITASMISNETQNHAFLLINYPLLVYITLFSLPTAMHYYSRIKSAPVSNTFKNEIKKIYVVGILLFLVVEWLLLIFRFFEFPYREAVLVSLFFINLLSSVIAHIYATRLVLKLSSESNREPI